MVHSLIFFGASAEAEKGRSWASRQDSASLLTARELRCKHLSKGKH
jgi:hypothetical protein